MEVSKASQFLTLTLGSDEIEFDEDGLYSLETERGVGFTFVWLQPELRLYVSPLTPEEYEAINDKTQFLEDLLALNYQSDISARRDLKAGFHPRVRVPMITTVTLQEQIQIELPQVEAMRKLCDELHAVALAIRDTASHQAPSSANDEAPARDEPEGADMPWRFDGPGLQV